MRRSLLVSFPIVDDGYRTKGSTMRMLARQVHRTRATFPVCLLAFDQQRRAVAQNSASTVPPPVTFTADQDHQNMMDQLGIQALRPGPSGDEKAPNHANYDESKANPYPNVPDPLTLNNGQKVTTPQMWWDERRPEIVDDVREVRLWPAAEKYSQGDLDGPGQRERAGRLPSRDRNGPHRPRRQLILSRDQRESCA